MAKAAALREVKKSASPLKVIKLPAVEFVPASVTLVGFRPLLVGRKTDGMDDAVGSTEAPVRGRGRKARDFAKEFIDCRHYMKLSGKEVEAFPSEAVMGVMIRFITNFVKGITPDYFKGSVRPTEVLMPIKYHHVVRHEAWGKNSNVQKTRMKRIRAEFHDWSMVFKFEYDKGSITLDQVLSILSSAGQKMGIGSYTVMSGTTGGWHGLFKIKA